MGIQSYILDGESVLSNTSTPFWNWICTDRRLIKYRSGNGTREEFHDISLSEVSGITYENKGRKDDLLGYGVITGFVTLVLFLLGSELDEGALYAFGLFSLLIAGILFYQWWESDDAYFEFRGHGLISDEQDKWRVKGLSSEDTDETLNFINTVRNQLS